MKKVISFIVFIALFISLCPDAAANAAELYKMDLPNVRSKIATEKNEKIKVKVNNQIVDFKNYSPYRSLSGIMVPIAEAAKAVGAKAEYMKNTNEVKVTYGNTVYIYKAGRDSVLIDGKSYIMYSPGTELWKSKLYVQVRFFYEKLDGTVKWDEKTSTALVTIKSKTPTPSLTAPDKVSDINVAMPADKDFKPYIAEPTPIDTEMLKELQAYKDNKDGELKYKKNGVGINNYISNSELIKKIGLEVIKNDCIFAKSMMEVENNVDYRTIGSNFIQQYRYFFMPESGMTWKVENKTYSIEDYIKLRYEDVIKYKIVQKAEFFTDTSLVYNDKNSENRVRGRLKFMFESVDPEYFKAYGLPNYELNKWYYADMEIRKSILFTHNDNKWSHSYVTYVDRFYLTNTMLR